MPSVPYDALPPSHSWMPEYHQTLGPEVADLCSSVGFVPDPEQRLALDWTFATDRAGRSAVRDIGICAPRQNMKTGYLKMAALGWLFVSELRLVVWSAHEFGTAQEAFRDMCILIESNPDLDAEVLRTSQGKTGIHRGNGDEAIELRGDRRLKFKARTKSGGRGLTGDRIVLDESMKLGADAMAALLPTLRAVKDPQVIYAGSAGLLESEVWRSVRDRGRPGNDPSLGWLEWGDPEEWSGCEQPDCLHMYGVSVGCAMDDERRYWRCNSALRSGRISVDSLRADRRSLKVSPIKFATETLGWWEDPPTGDTDDDVLANWAACGDPTAAPGAPLVLAVDVSHDSRSAVILACGTHQGMPCVEVVDYRVRKGVSWVPERLAALVEKHTPAGVAVMSGGPVSGLVKKRGEGTSTQHVIVAKVDGKDVPIPVRVFNSAEVAAASQAFAQDVAAGALRHRGEQALDISVRDAVRQLSGDGWRWSRRQSKSDISPLVAAVAARALWAAEPIPYDPLANFMPNL